jgi:membrane protein implicated in regulation of membrane protease activity
MNCMGMSNGMGVMMMLGMGVQGLLFLVLTVLAIAALVKYLRSSPR